MTTVTTLSQKLQFPILHMVCSYPELGKRIQLNLKEVKYTEMIGPQRKCNRPLHCLTEIPILHLFFLTLIAPQWPPDLSKLHWKSELHPPLFNQADHTRCIIKQENWQAMSFNSITVLLYQEHTDWDWRPKPCCELSLIYRHFLLRLSWDFLANSPYHPLNRFEFWAQSCRYVIDIFKFDKNLSVQPCEIFVQYLGVLLSGSAYSVLPSLLDFLPRTMRMSQVPMCNYLKCLLLIYLLESL